MGKEDFLSSYLRREHEKLINSKQYKEYQAMLDSGQISRRQFNNLVKSIGRSSRYFNSHSDSDEPA